MIRDSDKIGYSPRLKYTTEQNVIPIDEYGSERTTPSVIVTEFSTYAPSNICSSLSSTLAKLSNLIYNMRERNQTDTASIVEFYQKGFSMLELKELADKFDPISAPTSLEVFEQYCYLSSVGSNISKMIRKSFYGDENLTDDQVKEFDNEYIAVLSEKDKTSRDSVDYVNLFVNTQVLYVMSEFSADLERSSSVLNNIEKKSGHTDPLSKYPDAYSLSDKQLNSVYGTFLTQEKKSRDYLNETITNDFFVKATVNALNQKTEFVECHTISTSGNAAPAKYISAYQKQVETRTSDSIIRLYRTEMNFKTVYRSYLDYLNEKNILKSMYLSSR